MDHDDSSPEVHYLVTFCNMTELGVLYYENSMSSIWKNECQYVGDCNKLCYVHAFHRDTCQLNCFFLFFISGFINLLVKVDNFILLTVQQHQSAVIPCRPTSLDVNVTLWKDGTMVSSSIHQITTVQYDVSQESQFDMEDIWVQVKSVSWAFCQSGCISQLIQSMCLNYWH